MSEVSSPSDPSKGTRALAVLAILAVVATVLLALTLGTTVVGFSASAACAPEGGEGSCLAITLGPWVNVGLQVLLLVVGLTGIGRAMSGRDAATAVILIGLGTVISSVVLVAALSSMVIP